MSEGIENPNAGKMFQVRLWPWITVNTHEKGPKHRKGDELNPLLLDHDRFVEWVPEFKNFAGAALFKATKPFYVVKDGVRYVAVIKRIS